MWKGGCLLGVVVVVALVYRVYLYFHPYNHVGIEVRDMPADTAFACLLAQLPGGPVLMPISLQKVFPFTMHPDHCAGCYRGDGEIRPLRGHVRWVSGSRVGVLLKAKSKAWRIAWFDGAASRVQGRSLLLGGGSWSVSLLDAVREQPLDDAELRALGFDYALKEEK
jgi:hypothetical protein